MLRTMIDNWWLFRLPGDLCPSVRWRGAFCGRSKPATATAGICPCFNCCFVWAIGIWRRCFYARRWIETIKPYAWPGPATDGWSRSLCCRCDSRVDPVTNASVSGPHHRLLGSVRWHMPEYLWLSRYAGISTMNGFCSWLGLYRSVSEHSCCLEGPSPHPPRNFSERNLCFFKGASGLHSMAAKPPLILAANFQLPNVPAAKIICKAIRRDNRSMRSRTGRRRP